MQTKAETTTNPRKVASGHVWRVVLAVLVVVPFLPELGIYAIAALATWKCEVEQKAACLVGPISIGDMIATLLNAAVTLGKLFWFIAPVWLAACYLAVTRGWTNTASRLFVALVATLIFGILPYAAPQVLINNLVSSDCSTVPCWIFGSQVTDVVKSAPDLASWGALVGFVIAFAVFVLYAIGAIIFQLLRSMRKAAPRS